MNYGTSCRNAFHAITSGWKHCLDAAIQIQISKNTIYMVSGKESTLFPQGCFGMATRNEIYFNPSSRENVIQGHPIFCKSGTCVYQTGHDYLKTFCLFILTNSQILSNFHSNLVT